MKKHKLAPAAALFGLCYLAALLLWVAYCLGMSAVMLYHKANETMPQETLAPAEFTCRSFVNYQDLAWSTPPDDRPGWYLSTDDDPQLCWSGTAYLENVTLYAAHERPAGSVVLYYLLPGQTDYRETQKVYAGVSAPGQYTFALGGKTVAGLRIDPDSVGGVPTLFTGVELNPVRPWFLRFVPSGGVWVLLLGGPALAAALLAAFGGVLPLRLRRHLPEI